MYVNTTLSHVPRLYIKRLYYIFFPQIQIKDNKHFKHSVIFVQYIVKLERYFKILPYEIIYFSISQDLSILFAHLSTKWLLAE